MPFIADIAFERFGAPPGKQWVRFGSLFVGGVSPRLKLTGILVGPFAGKLKPGADSTYVAGDLYVRLGDLLGPGSYEEQWIGHIQTSDGDKGVVYFGEIMVVPLTTQTPVWAMVKE